LPISPLSLALSSWIYRYLWRYLPGFTGIDGFIFLGLPVSMALSSRASFLSAPMHVSGREKWAAIGVAMRRLGENAG